MESVAGRDAAAAVFSATVMLRAFGAFRMSMEGQVQSRRRKREQSPDELPADAMDLSDLEGMLRTAASMAQDHTSMALARLSAWRQRVLAVALTCGRANADCGVKLLQIVDSNTASASQAHLLRAFACSGAVAEAQEIERLSRDAMADMAGRISAAVTPALSALESGEGLGSGESKSNHVTETGT